MWGNNDKILDVHGHRETTTGSSPKSSLLKPWDSVERGLINNSCFGHVIVWPYMAVFTHKSWLSTVWFRSKPVQNRFGHNLLAPDRKPDHWSGSPPGPNLELDHGQVRLGSGSNHGSEPNLTIPSYEKSASALRHATQKLRATKGISLERWVNFVHYGA
jgi:hypothetical protein